MPNVYGEKSNLKVQWEKMKDAPLKERLTWMVQYFWLYALIIVSVIALGISFLVVYIRGKQPEVISGVFYNTYFEKEDENKIHDILTERLGIQKKGTRITLTPQTIDAEGSEYAIYQAQAIAARIAAKNLDLLGGTGTILQQYMNPRDIEDSLLGVLNEHLDEALLEALTEAGRIREVETASGTYAFFVRISGSRIAELLKIVSDDYWVGVACTAPDREAVNEFFKMALEPPIG
ncbi:MAG: hypothetical protein IK088_02720 [Lachnospiraceae bacterium]|nr:hypothetical protein [Lachnospiraceae bacterium]